MINSPGAWLPMGNPIKAYGLDILRRINVISHWETKYDQTTVELIWEGWIPLRDLFMTDTYENVSLTAQGNHF